MHGDANWYKNESGWLDGAKATFTEAELSNNSTWGFHQDYIVTFHNGNTTFYGIEMYDGEEKINYLRGAKDSTPELPAPEKEGYTFVGWKTADEYAYDASTPLKGDITLYAQWEEEVEDLVQEIIYHSSLEGVEKVFVGTQITLTAELKGYKGSYEVQWMYEDPKNPGKHVEIPGATGTEYTFNLNETNCTYLYFVTVIPN